MFKLEKDAGLGWKERNAGWKERNAGKLGGGDTYCGSSQKIIAVLSCTTALLFFLLVYVISVEESSAVNFWHENNSYLPTSQTHSETKIQAPVDPIEPDLSVDPVEVDDPPVSRPSIRTQDPVVLKPEVQKLVDAIKAATLVANGGSEPTWTEDEREEWKEQNPCRSREELVPLYSRRNHVEHVGSNPQWDAVLREYAKMHRACLQSAGDLGEYFANKSSKTGCKFLVADVQIGTGLGNKVLVILSNILYGILTQRVVLVPVTTLLPFIMCEPFEGSSWRTDNFSLPFPPTSHTKKWQFPEYFYRGIDSGKTVTPPYSSAVTVVSRKIKDQWHPRERFYCSSSQEHYDKIPWLYMTGCLYTLPNLFAIGSLRPTLEALFPDKMALTHLLRSIMLPADTVWDRVQRINDAYLNHADRRVGIQVRYKDELPHYNAMNDIYNNRITKCALDNGFLPSVNYSVDSRTDDSHFPEVALTKPKVVTVFIACLYTGLRDHLTRLFLRHPTITGETVGLVQVTHEDVQEFGVEVDRQALAEVFGLSLSDDLLVTPISTYGGLAQAYGALRPWFIEIRNVSTLSCTRGITVDICYQGGARKYDCPLDEDVNGKLIADVVPYLRPCLLEDYPKGGVQLFTDFEE